MSESTTNFGYQKVNWDDKQNLVNRVFSSVASKYDIMNDLMSFGIHRIWKKIAISHCGLIPGNTVLDLAGGTGDLSKEIAKVIGTDGLLIMADINDSMLEAGREKLTNLGIIKPLHCLQLNAEQLSLMDDSFDCITISFGLRNVTDKSKALQEMYRVLRPGGRLVILEFSKPVSEHLAKLYDLYSFKVLPTLGKIVAKDSDSYQYLAESIRMHPDQDNLKNMMSAVGFERCSYQNLTGGICAIHKGYKF